MTTTLHQRRQVWDALTTYPGAGTGTLVEATGLSHNLTLNILNDLYGKGRAERRQRRAEDPRRDAAALVAPDATDTRALVDSSGGRRLIFTRTE